LDSCELKPWVWWQFLDDVFMIWLHGENELNDFLMKLNSFHENITFTWKINLRKIAFLDRWITKVNGAFYTDMFFKPTDAHQYLNFKSCHLPHVKEQSLIARICI
jgi:hypothetical protein